MSDARIRQRSVKLKERETEGQRKEGAPPPEHPGPGEPTTGAGRESPRAGNRRTPKQAETNPLEAGSAPV